MFLLSEIGGRLIGHGVGEEISVLLLSAVGASCMRHGVGDEVDSEMKQ